MIKRTLLILTLFFGGLNPIVASFVTTQSEKSDEFTPFLKDGVKAVFSVDNKTTDISLKGDDFVLYRAPVIRQQTFERPGSPNPIANTKQGVDVLCVRYNKDIHAGTSFGDFVNAITGIEAVVSFKTIMIEIPLESVKANIESGGKVNVLFKAALTKIRPDSRVYSETRDPKEKARINEYRTKKFEEYFKTKPDVFGDYPLSAQSLEIKNIELRMEIDTPAILSKLKKESEVKLQIKGPNSTVGTDHGNFSHTYDGQNRLGIENIEISHNADSEMLNVKFSYYAHFPYTTMLQLAGKGFDGFNRTPPPKYAFIDPSAGWLKIEITAGTQKKEILLDDIYADFVNALQRALSNGAPVLFDTSRRTEKNIHMPQEHLKDGYIGIRVLAKTPTICGVEVVHSNINDARNPADVINIAGSAYDYLCASRKYLIGRNVPLDTPQIYNPKYTGGRINFEIDREAARYFNGTPPVIGADRSDSDMDMFMIPPIPPPAPYVPPSKPSPPSNLSPELSKLTEHLINKKYEEDLAASKKQWEESYAAWARAGQGLGQLFAMSYLRAYSDPERKNLIHFRDEKNDTHEAYLAIRKSKEPRQQMSIPLSQYLPEGEMDVYLTAITEWFPLRENSKAAEITLKRSTFKKDFAAPIRIRVDRSLPSVKETSGNEITGINAQKKLSVRIEDSVSDIDTASHKLYKLLLTNPAEEDSLLNNLDGELKIGQGFQKIELARKSKTHTAELYPSGMTETRVDQNGNKTSGSVSEDNENTIHYLFFFARDDAGNESIIGRYRFKYVNTPPDIEVEPSDAFGGNIKITDEDSAIIKGKIKNSPFAKNAAGSFAGTLQISGKSIPLDVRVFQEKPNRPLSVYASAPNLDSFGLENKQDVRAVLRIEDPAGNFTETAVNTDVDLFPYTIEAPDTMYVRAWRRSPNEQKMSLSIPFKTKEYSPVRIRRGDKIIASSIVRPTREYEVTQIDELLPEGTHNIVIEAARAEKAPISKSVRLIIDNTSPEVKDLKENTSGRALSRGQVNYLNAKKVDLSGDLVDASPSSVKFILDPPKEANVEWLFNTVSTAAFPFRPSSELSDGRHDLYILTEDLAGNQAISPVPLEIDSKPVKMWLSPDDTYAQSVVDGGVSEATVVFDGKSDVIIRGKAVGNKATNLTDIEISGLRTQSKAKDYGEGWGVRIPAQQIPTRRDTRVLLKATDIYGNTREIPVNILAASDAPKILLDKQIPEYVNSDKVKVKGRIVSLSKTKDLYVQIDDSEKIPLVENEAAAGKSRFEDTKWNPATQEFEITLDVKERKNPYNLMIVARNIAGVEDVYKQDYDGRLYVPSFYVKTSKPSRPSIKLDSLEAARANFSGSGDPGATIEIEDASGNLVSKVSAIYQQEDSAEGRWAREVKGLRPGDYTLYAVCVDRAGNRSARSAPVRFTVVSVNDAKPRIHYPTPDAAISDTRQPQIRGETPVSNAVVMLFDNNARLGDTVSDAAGKFSFTPPEPLFNGYHNITARVYKDGQVSEASEVLSFEMRVFGAPSANTLVLETSGKSYKELQDIPVKVKDFKGNPIIGASVWIDDGVKKQTNAEGCAYVRAPAVDSRIHTIESKVHAEKRGGPDGNLYGNSVLNIYNGGTPLIVFSPNNDGMNDYIVWKQEEVPVKIYRFRGNKLIRTVTESDSRRWDGIMSNGIAAEIGIYAAETSDGRKTFINLLR